MIHRPALESLTWPIGGRLRDNRTVTPESYAGLPGADVVAEGLRDLMAGRETLASLIVQVGAPRLRELGFEVPFGAPLPEHRLYALLARESPDIAHARYNAWIRRLVSFERALACAS